MSMIKSKVSSSHHQLSKGVIVPSSINNHQSSIINQQPTINNHQSPIKNHKSLINNHQKVSSSHSHLRNASAVVVSLAGCDRSQYEENHVLIGSQFAIWNVWITICRCPALVLDLAADADARRPNLGGKVVRISKLYKTTISWWSESSFSWSLFSLKVSFSLSRLWVARVQE